MPQRWGKWRLKRRPKRLKGRRLKRRTKKKGQMSNKQLTYAVRGLQKQSQLFRVYSYLNNQAVDNGQFTAIALDRIAYNGMSQTIVTPYCRERDTISCILKTLTIHCYVHASGPDDAEDVNHCYVALIRSSNRDNSGNFAVPSIGQIFDDLAPANNLVPKFNQFRNVTDPNIKETKILKQWRFTLSPNQQAGSPNVPGGAPPEFPLKSYPSFKYIEHTHNCLNTKLMFASETDTVPIQETGRYYLIATSNNTSGQNLCRINAVCKTTGKADA